MAEDQHDPSNHAEVFHQALNTWTDRRIAEAFEAVCAGLPIQTIPNR
jgi:hypothetical protein